MKLNISIEDLRLYLLKQIQNIVPDDEKCSENLLSKDINTAIERCEYCFKHIKNSAYCNEKNETFFSHLHADQYATFLVYLSNGIWKERQDKNICDRIMYVNRVLHSFMMSYKAKVPDIFWLAHPVGSVIGNADYSDYLYISQNCTINTAGSADDLRPHIGKYFAMGAGAALIGDKNIGDNCSIGVNTLLYNTELKNNSIAINDNGVVKIITKETESFAHKMFN